MNNFYFIGWVVLVLYILQETDALPQWGKLLRFKFLKYAEYEKQLSSGFGLNLKYTHFLLSKYPNFLVYLFSCQECLAVWFCIAGFIASCDKMGGWITFGWTTVASILAIAVFKFVLRKLYA